MYSLIEIDQRSGDWHAWRMGGIGGSEIAAVLGISPYKTAYGLWKEKLGISEDAFEDTPAVKYGRAMESSILEKYNACTGRDCSPACIQSCEHEFIRASLDGLSLKHSRAVEIKTMGLEAFEGVKKGIIPMHYMAQCQYILMITGYKEMDLVVENRGEIYIHVIKADKTAQVSLFKSASEFWLRVQNCDPPEMSSKEIQKLNSVNLEGDVELKALISEYADLYKMVKSYEGRLAEIKDILKARGDGRGWHAFGCEMVHRLEKGRIQYSDIPELKGVDLEPYRSNPVEKWILKLSEDF